MRTNEAISQYTEYSKNLGEKFRVNGFILKNFANYVGHDKELADRINATKSTQLISCMQTTRPVWVVMLTLFKDDLLRVDSFAFSRMGAWISNGAIW